MQDTKSNLCMLQAFAGPPLRPFVVPSYLATNVLYRPWPFSLSFLYSGGPFESVLTYGVFLDILS